MIKSEGKLVKVGRRKVSDGVKVVIMIVRVRRVGKVITGEGK